MSQNTCIDVTDLYKEYNKRFMAWANKYHPKLRSYHRDVFHDTLVLYYEYCQKGKFQNLHAPLINLLIGIAYNFFRRPPKGGSLPRHIMPITYIEDMPLDMQQSIESIVADIDILEEIIEIEKDIELQACYDNSWDTLTDRCKRLILRRKNGESLKDIAKEEGYKDENVAGAAIGFCIAKLRELIKKCRNNLN